MHKEELLKLYSSPRTLIMSKSRRMGLTGHEARLGRKGMDVGYQWESQKGRDHEENQDVGGWIMDLT
jgi:hypothetical protein